MNTRTIALVDDDADLLVALRRLLAANGYQTIAYQRAEDFLQRHAEDGCECVILDLRMPGIDGLAVQDLLAGSGSPMPIVFLSGEGDIPSSVRAIKAGAQNFLTKPVDAPQLLEAVRGALAEAARMRADHEASERMRARFATLTAREAEVLRHVITGKLNKQIAGDLGISEQTVKIHRMRLTEKTRLLSVAELVRAADQIGIEPAS